MDTRVSGRNGGTADRTGWRLLYVKAKAMMDLGKHEMAADVLRMLALASPGEFEVWNALATCHDAQERPDIAETL